jgi:hypothetical protein
MMPGEKNLEAVGKVPESQCPKRHWAKLNSNPWVASQVSRRESSQAIKLEAEEVFNMSTTISK